MNREIDLFEGQNVVAPPQIKEVVPHTPKEAINHTDIRSIFTLEGKEVPVYFIEKGSMIYPARGARGLLQNIDGLRCVKYLSEDGKTKKNTSTGLTQYQALEHYHVYLNDQHRSYSKDSFFSTFAHLAKRSSARPKVK